MRTQLHNKVAFHFYLFIFCLFHIFFLVLCRIAALQWKWMHKLSGQTRSQIIIFPCVKKTPSISFTQMDLSYNQQTFNTQKRLFNFRRCSDHSQENSISSFCLYLFVFYFFSYYFASLLGSCQFHNSNVKALSPCNEILWSLTFLINNTRPVHKTPKWNSVIILSSPLETLLPKNNIWRIICIL